MKIVMLIILLPLVVCSANDVVIHPTVNHVSRMMLKPDLFVEKAVTVFGLLSKSGGDNLILLPDTSFEGLPKNYQDPYSVSIAPSLVRVNFELNAVCLGRIVSIEGVVKKKFDYYMIYPDIITQLKPESIKEKNCFVKK